MWQIFLVQTVCRQFVINLCSKEWNADLGLFTTLRTGKLPFSLAIISSFKFYAYDTPGRQTFFSFSLNYRSWLVLSGNSFHLTGLCECPLVSLGFFRSCPENISRKQVTHIYTDAVKLRSFPFIRCTTVSFGHNAELSQSE